MTDWKSILLHAAPDTLEGAKASIGYATSLASAMGADVTAIAFAFKIPTPFSLRAGLDRSAADQQHAALRQAAERAVTDVKTACATAGLGCEQHIETCLSVDAPANFARHARLHDVTVLVGGDDGSGDNRSLLEAAMFETGRPVIVLPPNGSGTFRGDTIAIAWNDSPQAARAVTDAMPLLQKAGAVHVISVTDEDSARARMPGDKLVAYLKRHGVQAVADDIVARHQSVHEAVGARVAQIGADALVMGAYGHSRLREQILGGNTEAMLRDPPLPILMSH